MDKRIMNITILNVVISTQPAKKPGGKPYQLAEVAFKNNTYGGKVEGKKITSYSKAYTAVAEAQPGEHYEVETEKNGEFVEWVSLQKTSADVGKSMPSVVSGSTADRNGVSSFTSPRSTYETPEERAKKQVYIVRQSSIANAIAALSVGSKMALKPDDVVSLARAFECYVFDTSVVELNPAFDNGEPNIE